MQDAPLRDPFRALISTVISQRVRDETTEAVSAALFDALPTARAMANASETRIRELIRPAGFYRQKAARIRRIARSIVDDHGGAVPCELPALLALPGVGRKTANCVLVYGFGVPALPVDTHLHRISNRLGWVRTKTPDQTEAALAQLLPRKHWLSANHVLIAFGKEICRPVSPRCGDCPIADLCPSSSSCASTPRPSKK